jgi:hypothetical protein
MKHTKTTPFLVVLFPLGIFLLFMAFYYLFINGNGGNSLAGIIFLMVALCNFFLLFLERLIANYKSVTIKWLWILESIIILVVTIYIALNGISIG